VLASGEWTDDFVTVRCGTLQHRWILLGCSACFLFVSGEREGGASSWLGKLPQVASLLASQRMPQRNSQQLIMASSCAGAPTTLRPSLPRAATRHGGTGASRRPRRPAALGDARAPKRVRSSWGGASRLRATPSLATCTLPRYACWEIQARRAAQQPGPVPRRRGEACKAVLLPALRATAARRLCKPDWPLRHP
jgi:hypothetical protein